MAATQTKSPAQAQPSSTVTVSNADANTSDTPVRPPARPQPRNSRHALEPNPFEQSFSSKPASSASPDHHSSEPSTEKAEQKAEDAQKGAADKATSQPQPANKASTSPRANATSTPSPKDSSESTPSKRLLPPVAAITSPTSEGGNQYPWSGGGIGSLRAGPLSPAMLTGPQNHPFDPSSFRTGFTPDLSNFKTGLTPLGSGSGFPPPSPGTAAFLAMVNSSGPAITPNTLSALTGNTSALIGGDAQANTTSQPENRGGASNGPGNASNGDFDLAFGKQNQQSSVRQPSNLRKDGGMISESVSPEMIQRQLANGAQQQQQQPQRPSDGKPGPTQAASGLFLLSQAHQELSKRDEAAAQAAAGQPLHPPMIQRPNGMVSGAHPMMQPGPSPPNQGQRLPQQMPQQHRPQQHQHQQQQHQAFDSAPPPPPKGTKRKKSNTNAGENGAGPGSQANANASSNGAASGSGGKGGGKKSKSVKIEEPVSDAGNDSDDGAGDESKDVEGEEGMDEEEKRKNFLERNRQAALKCRQRKKAWLQDLQAKVAFFEAENGNLQGTIGALRSEVMFLKSQLMQAQQQMASKGMSMPMPVPGIPAPMGQDPGMMGVGPGMPMPPGMHQHPHQHQPMPGQGPMVQGAVPGVGPSGPPMHPGAMGGQNSFNQHGPGPAPGPGGRAPSQSFSPVAGPKAQPA